MSLYIVKNPIGTFCCDLLPEGFKALAALENRMWIVDSPTRPVFDFVVEFPLDQYNLLKFYYWPNGKKLGVDPFNGAVEFDSVVDDKGRRAIKYNLQQLTDRLSIMKWLMLNVWAPDKKRILGLTDADFTALTTAVNELTVDTQASTFITNNLYYDL